MTRSLILFFFIVFSFVATAQRKKNNNLPPEKQAEAEALFSEGMKFSITDNYADALKMFEQASVINPDNAGTLYMMSKMQAKLAENSTSITGYDKETLRKAIESGEKASKANAENQYYRIHLAELYTKNDDNKKAIEIYENMLKQNPNDINTALELANLHLNLKNYEEAIKAYNKIEEVTGVTEEISRQKQLIYLRINKLEDALKEGEKLIAEESGDPDLMLQQAQMLMSNEQLDQAQTWIEKALSLNPDNPEALIMLAEVLRKKGDYTACDEALKKAFRNPNLKADVKVKILSSYLVMQQGGDKNATENIISLANELISNSPQEVGSYIILADAYMRKGEKEQARNNYLKASQINGAMQEVWMALLQLDSELNQIDSLANHSEKAVEYFPNQGVFWYQNGFANYALKKYEKTATSLEEAKNLSTENSELTKHINALLGDAYNSLKNYEKSDATYEEVLAQDPNYDHVLNNYSYFLSVRKTDLEKAVKMSGKLVERNPNDATYLDTHAWVLYMQKDYTAARKYLEQALQNEQGISGTIIEHYGDVLYQLGDKAKALEQWQKAKQKGEVSDKLEQKIKTNKLIE